MLSFKWIFSVRILETGHNILETVRERKIDEGRSENVFKVNVRYVTDDG